MHDSSRAALAAAVIGVAVLAVPPPAAAQVDRAMDTVKQTNTADAASQDKIDRLSEETRRMLEEYRNAIRKTQQLKVYNKELSQIVDQQQQRKAQLEQRIDAVGDLREDIEPLMLRMIDSLKRFVEADLPFKKNERMQKIAELRQAMADPDTGVAEKFRKVLAAYQREAEYGRTIGTYRGELTFSGKQRLVEFLRIGRVMLFYITPDDAAVGYYDPDAGQWRPLEAGYRATVRQGIKVAKDLAPPQLIEIAAPAPIQAGSGDQSGGDDSDDGEGS